MALKIGDNFKFEGQKTIDERMMFKTIAEMKSYSATSLPELFISTCTEDKSIYFYSSSNEDNPVTGKWRKVVGVSDEMVTDINYVKEQIEILLGEEIIDGGEFTDPVNPDEDIYDAGEF